MKTNRTIRTIIAIFLATLASPASEAAETWLTGSPRISNGVLLFQTPEGPTYKLGTSRDATSLLGPLQACAQKGVVIRAYGDLRRDATTPPNYSGPALPKTSFIVWKIHMPNERDTFDRPAPAPQISDKPFRFFNVKKGTQLRAEIILGLRRAVYRNEALARSNPNNTQFVLGPCICDGETAAVKVISGTGRGAVNNPIPLLVLLKHDANGNWFVTNEITAITPALREQLIAQGLPRELL